jgi:hypothetical protein
LNATPNFIPAVSSRVSSAGAIPTWVLSTLSRSQGISMLWGLKIKIIPIAPAFFKAVQRCLIAL